MSDECSNCAALEAQIHQLQELLMEEQIRLALLKKEVATVAVGIAAELEKPTMGRRDLLEQVQARLVFGIEMSEQA